MNQIEIIGSGINFECVEIVAARSKLVVYRMFSLKNGLNHLILIIRTIVFVS